MDKQSYQHRFLSSLSYYSHSLLLSDGERIECAKKDAINEAQKFIGECEGDVIFESGLVKARELIFAGGAISAPESTPLVSIGIEEEKLPWESKPSKQHSSGKGFNGMYQGMSKSDFLANVSEASGVKEIKFLHEAMVVARMGMKKENGRFIYTSEDVQVAINYLKK
jgi:hypothetical protein